MKIFDLNTWHRKGPWQERWNLIFEEIRRSQPDIAAFQEVFSRDWAEQAGKKTGYDSSIYHEERSGLLLISKFKVRRSLSVTMKTQSSTEDYKRYVLFAEFETGKGSLCVFNTHLSWKPAEADVRFAQADEFLAFTEKEAGRNLSIACGDFNAAPDTAEIRKIQAAGWTDTFAAANPASQALTWDNRNPYAASSSVFLPDRRIDYIFMKNAAGKAKVMTSKIVLDTPDPNGIYASDHYAVLTEIKTEV